MMGEGLQVSYRNFKLERINILRVYCLKEKILISQEFLCGLSEYQMNEGGMGADPQPLLHLCIPPPHPHPPSGLVLSCWALDGVQGGAALPAASVILPWPLPSGLPLRRAVLQCDHWVERLLLLQVLPVPAALE